MMHPVPGTPGTPAQGAAFSLATTPQGWQTNNQQQGPAAAAPAVVVVAQGEIVNQGQGGKVIELALPAMAVKISKTSTQKKTQQSRCRRKALLICGFVLLLAAGATFLLNHMLSLGLFGGLLDQGEDEAATAACAEATITTMAEAEAWRHCKKLRKISMHGKTSGGDRQLRRLSSNGALSFDALEIVAEGISVTDVAALTGLTMPLLRLVNGPLVVSGNPQLLHVALPRFQVTDSCTGTAWEGQNACAGSPSGWPAVFEDNAALVDVDLSALNDWDAARMAGMHIAGNAAGLEVRVRGVPRHVNSNGQLDTNSVPAPPPTSAPELELVTQFSVIYGFSEMCGKSCDSPGVNCNGQQQSTLAECEAVCARSPTCLGYQAPDVHNGFHGWCVTMNYVPQRPTAPLFFSPHNCHHGQSTFARVTDTCTTLAGVACTRSDGMPGICTHATTSANTAAVLPSAVAAPLFCDIHQRWMGRTTTCSFHNTPNTQQYTSDRIILDSTKAITFEVKANNDAHVGFFNDANVTSEMYEIVISGWSNTQSVIRESNQGTNQVTVSTNGILSGSAMVRFWADAVGGLVRLGTGHTVGQNIVMQWQDPTPHGATQVGLMTGWGATGVWEVCVGAPTNTTPCLVSDTTALTAACKCASTSSTNECAANKFCWTDNTCNATAKPSTAVDLTCSFEDTSLCGWAVSGAGHWKRGSSTPSVSTGATAAADGSHFMFIEASSPSKQGDVSYLVSPSFSAGMYSTMSWSHHMHGSTMGTLRVEAFYNSSWVELWQRSNQQTSHQAAAWSVSEAIGLPPGTTQVRFTGVRGSSFKSDMCVDMVNLSTPTTPYTPGQVSPWPTTNGRTWDHCATEHRSGSAGTCHCAGTVRYGKGATWTAEQLIDGDTPCNNTTFGDPLQGTVKECQCRSNGCIAEGATCSASGVAGVCGWAAAWGSGTQVFPLQLVCQPQR